MARGRPGLVAIRRILTTVLLFGGLFVLCFGIGYRHQTVVISGATIMALAGAAWIATRFRRAPRQWVRGTGQVLEVSDPPTDARFGRCAIRMVVDVPGLPSEEVLVDDSRVPVVQWPKRGEQLPIQVAADDVRNVRVRWRYHVPAESAFEAAFEDDQPPPVPAEPPPSQLDTTAPAELGTTGPTAEIDFDIDRPPTDPIRPVAPAQPAAPAAGAAGTRLAELTPPDEGRPDRDVPLPEQHRVPRPRPSPHPHPDPAPAAASAATTTETAAATLAPEVDDLVTTYPSAHPVPAGAIHGVSVTISVADLARSIAFYRDTLGFYEVDGGEDSVVLASGETRLVLVRSSDLAPPNRRLIHLLLEVADVEAMYAELKRNGIRFTYPPRPVNRSARLELWAAPFRDPDGHGIAISQWRPA